jgi:hypothetical protein
VAGFINDGDAKGRSSFKYAYEHGGTEWQADWKTWIGRRVIAGILWTYASE